VLHPRCGLGRRLVRMGPIGPAQMMAHGPPFTVHVPCSFHARSLAEIHAGRPCKMHAREASNLINQGVRAADASSVTSVLVVTTKYMRL
jgi:hypothetical protein